MVVEREIVRGRSGNSGLLLKFPVLFAKFPRRGQQCHFTCLASPIFLQRELQLAPFSHAWETEIACILNDHEQIPFNVAGILAGVEGTAVAFPLSIKRSAWPPKRRP